MASKESHYILAEILLGLLMMSTLNFTVAQTGVCYGLNGGSLPSPAQVVDLYNRNSIRRMRIYDPNQSTLQALACSNIELMLGVPNTDLQSVASSQENANNWVRTNVLNHPCVRFRYISVGNVVSPLRDESRQYVNFLLPALRNIHTAISAAGLGIRVSTAIDTGLLGNTNPPADGAFREDLNYFVDPIIHFLADTGAPLLLNMYPYFAYIGDPEHIRLDYALFSSQQGVNAGGTQYQNLFYAMLDATYAAVERRGSSLNIVVSETGWPSAGGNAASLDNARTYNTNLVRAVRSGTPRRPGAIETYMFAMFDEDKKDAGIERNFGLFRPNEQQPKYPISFA